MILALFLACSGPRSASELPSAESPPTAEEAPGEGSVVPVSGLPDAPADAPGVGVPAADGRPALTPAESYAGCLDRLEGPQSAGECTTDADCSTVGCSSEVCTAAVTAPDVMTTCEVLPCFAAVDSCGCHAGVCTWTLKSAMPTPGRVPFLPPKQP